MGREVRSLQDAGTGYAVGESKSTTVEPGAASDELSKHAVVPVSAYSAALRAWRRNAKRLVTVRPLTRSTELAATMLLRVQPAAARRVVLIVAAALGLAGCFEASGTGQPAAPAATMGAPPPGGPNAAEVVAPQSASAQASGPMTPTKAREICWMSVENDKKTPSDLDKRAKLVDQCVSAKMSGR
jgi:hypothetical protein